MKARPIGLLLMRLSRHDSQTGRCGAATLRHGPCNCPGCGFQRLAATRRGGSANRVPVPAACPRPSEFRLRRQKSITPRIMCGTWPWLSGALQAQDDGRAAKFLSRCPLLSREWEWFALRQQIKHETPSRMEPSRVPVSGLACSPSGRYLAAFGQDNRDDLSLITIWDQSGKLVSRQKVGNAVQRLTWAADSESLIGLDKSGTVRNFDPQVANLFGGRVQPFALPNRILVVPHHRLAAIALRGANGELLACTLKVNKFTSSIEPTASKCCNWRGEEILSLACCSEKTSLPPATEAAGWRFGI